MAWTAATRGDYVRPSGSYVTDREWALIAPRLPAARPGGRPRTTCLRRVMNAIFYLLQTGCQWRMLPQDFLERFFADAGYQGPRLPVAYIFSAIRPATGEDATLVLRAVNAAAMQVFVDHVAASRPPDVHVVVVLDGVGLHRSRDLVVPETVTLVVLPPYSPELNPVERVWLYLRERFLSLRLLACST